VNTNVSEGDVGRLEDGMPAYFTVDAFPGERFKGKISQIRNSATTVSNVVTYDAVIDVNNTDGRLRPGMTANATVTYADKKDVLAIPNAALRFKPPPEANAPKAAGSAASARPSDGQGGGGGGGRGTGRGDKSNDVKAIWVLTDGVPAQISIKTGLSDGAYTEVVTAADADDAGAVPAAPLPPGPGVKEGDIVIVDATVTGKEATTAAPTTTARRSPF
jgi:HlyD family secretion protein